MKVIAERLDYLWFLGYGLEDEIPDHSVLSKARGRWGKEVFESLFVRTIAQGKVEKGSELSSDTHSLITGSTISEKDFIPLGNNEKRPTCAIISARLQ
jgi:IS5 family transposase